MPTPRLGRSVPKSNKVAPILKSKRSGRTPASAVKLTSWTVPTKPDIWGIGDGPWYWSGQRATRPEYITLLVLKKLGWHPKFQTNIAGGRRLPGGQVLDIIIEECQPPVYISVKGYYHQGAEQNYYDLYKEIVARSILGGAKVLTVWEKDIDQPGVLEDYLRREVGVRGR